MEDMSAIALTIAALAATASLDSADTVDESQRTDVVEAQADREARLTVPVTVDGKGPFRFLIDTGSERTVLSSALAGRLGLPEGPGARVVGVAGVEDVRTAHVGSIDLGSRRFTRLTAPLLERHHMGADGIVGTDSLQNQRVMLDFESDMIEIGDARSLGGNRGYEIVVRARQRSGQLIMTSARIDGVRVAVVLDTGAGTSVGNRALQRALRKRGSEATPVTLLSVTGQKVIADIGFASELDISDLTVTNLVIAFTDTPAFTRLRLDRKPALFLGMREMRLFRRVAIDFEKRSVLFDLPAQP